MTCDTWKGTATPGLLNMVDLGHFSFFLRWSRTDSLPWFQVLGQLAAAWLQEGEICRWLDPFHAGLPLQGHPADCQQDCQLPGQCPADLEDHRDEGRHLGVEEEEEETNLYGINIEENQCIGTSNGWFYWCSCFSHKLLLDILIATPSAYSKYTRFPLVLPPE